MLRRLLVVFALLGAGVALSQSSPTIYAEDLLALVDYQEVIEAVGFVGAELAGTGLIVDLNVVDFRSRARESYSVTGNCHYYDAGFGECSRTPPGYLWFDAYSHGYVDVLGCAESPPGVVRYRGAVRTVLLGSTYYSNCSADVEVATDYVYSFRKVPLLEGTWVVTGVLGALSGAPGLSSPGSDAEFYTHLKSALALGVLQAEPTVDDLVADWGFTVYGDYLDGGYSRDGEDPDGDGSGTDWDSAPTDSGCRIFDLFCWARWAFVPSGDFGGAITTLRSNAAGRVPMGFFSMTPAHGDGDTGLVLDSSPVCVFTGVGAGDLPPRIQITEGQYVALPRMRLDDSQGVVWWHENGRQWLWWIFVAAFPIGVIRMVVK